MIRAVRSVFRRFAGPEATLGQIPFAMLRKMFGDHLRIRRGGHPFTIDLRDVVVGFDILTNRYERRERSIVEKLVRSGDRVVDVGAHIGYYAVLFGRLVGPEGRVFAFEPLPENLEVLRRNVRDNGMTETIRIVDAAVGASAGSADLFPSASGNRGDNRMYEATQSGGGVAHRNAAPVNVRVVTVDAELSDLNRIDLIKMDVQGFETYAFEGMREIVAKNPNLVLLTEFWPYGLRAAGSSAAAYHAALVTDGFECYEIGAPRIEFGERRIAELEASGAYVDLCCVRPSAISCGRIPPIEDLLG